MIFTPKGDIFQRFIRLIKRNFVYPPTTSLLSILVFLAGSRNPSDQKRGPADCTKPWLTELTELEH